jgi:hypothetical protein
MRPTAAHTLGTWLPRSRVYLSARGGHTWVASRAEEFAAAVARFLPSRKRKRRFFR